MKRAHKLLSLLLVLTLALSVCVPAGAAYSDTSGHWAESAIDRWSAYGIVSGDGNGFNPDGDLTRGQMAKILAEALGLTKQAEQNPFADVSADAWYAPYVLRCYEAGIMLGDGANANPNASITREEAMVMLCRALGIAPASEGALASFSDSGSVASWAAPYVAAMVQSGIVNGVGNNSLAPTGNISRAALMTILDRSVVQYINEPGSYELTDKAGIVLVAAGDVTLTGETRADVLVSPAAEGKAVAFDKATVTGSVTVQAEDVKVTSENSTLPSVSFTGEGGGEVETVKPTEPTKPTTPTGGGSSGGSGGGGGSSHTHSWGEGVATTPATCTEAGVMTYTCSCGETKTEAIEALGHDVEDVAYTSDETGHWHICNRCHEPADKTAHTYPEGTACASAATCDDCGYEKAAGAHIWGEGVATTPATCTEAGVMTYTCTVCDEGSKTETTPAKGHTEVVDAAIEPDCLGPGKTEGKHCSVCNTVLVAQETVAALGHDVEGAAYSKDESGHWHVCARCEKEVDKSAHNYGEIISCDDAATCTVCGYEKAPGKHVWGDAVETKAATCTEAGEKTYTCTVCGETKTEEIAKLAHTEVVDEAVAATCTDAGKTEGKHCSVCNTVITAQTEVPATGHSYSVWEKVDDTNHKRTCANDATHDETGEHSWNEGVVTTAPTGTTAGVKTFTCTVCKGTKTETLPAETPGNPWIELYQSRSLRINFTSDELLKLLPEDNTNLSALVGQYTLYFGDQEVYSTSVPAKSPLKNDTFSLYIYLSTYTLSKIGPQQSGMTLTLKPAEGSALTAPVTLTNDDFSYTYSKLKTPASQKFTMQYVEEDSKIYFSGLDLAAYDYAVDLISNEYSYTRRNYPLNWDYTKECYYYGGQYEQWDKTLGNRMSLQRFDVAVSPNSVSLTQTAAVLPWFTGQYLGGAEYRQQEIAGTTTLSFAPGEASSIYTTVGNGIFTLATTSEGTFTQYGHMSSNGSNSGSSYGMQKDGKSAQLSASSFLFSSMGEFGAFDEGEIRYEWFYFKDAEGAVSAVSPVLIVSAEKADAVTAVDGEFSFEGDENGFYYITNEPGQGQGSMSGSTTTVRGTTVTGSTKYLDSSVAAPAVWYWDGALTTDSDGNYQMNFIYYPIVEK